MLYLFVKWNIEVKHALRLKFLTQTAFHLLSIAIPEAWSLNQTLQGIQTKPNQIRAYLTLITSISSGKVCNFFSSTIYSLLRINFLALRCASEKGDKCEVWIRANQTRQPNQTKQDQTRGPNSLHTCNGPRGLQSGKDNEPKPPPDPPQPRASQWRQSDRKFCSSFLLGFIYLLVFRLQVHLVQFFVPFWARFMFFFVFF